jgi:peroxiredoxin
MKLLLSVTYLFISIIAFSQETVNLKIELEGFGKTNKLSVSINGKRLKTNNKGEILYNGPLKINGPTFGMVIKKTGTYAGFWIEPSNSTVIVHNKNFPSSIEVPGSNSHLIYDKINYESDPKILKQNLLTYKDEEIALSVWDSKFKFQKLEKSDLIEIYNQIDPKHVDLIKNIRAFIVTSDSEKVKKGGEIIDFVAIDAKGEVFDTKNYRGNYLLLDFAGTSCGWCWKGYKDMIPDLPSYTDLQVLTINEDENIEGWTKMAENSELKFPWPVLWDGENKQEIFELYGIGVLPTFFLISPDGIVAETWIGTKHNKLIKTLDKHLK